MTATCLIAEADPFIIRLLQRFAEKIGLQTVQAHIGQDLLAMARATRPGVIILDVELPGTIRGWEAGRLLAADPELAKTPVVACSWLAEAEALICGAAGYLQKPDLHYDDFVAAMQRAGIMAGV